MSCVYIAFVRTQIYFFLWGCEGVRVWGVRRALVTSFLLMGVEPPLSQQETNNLKCVSGQGGSRAFVSRPGPSGATWTPMVHTLSHQSFFPEEFHRRTSQEIRRAKAMAAPAITSWTLVGPKSRKYYLVGPYLQKRISGIVSLCCFRFVCLSMWQATTFQSRRWKINNMGTLR